MADITLCTVLLYFLEILLIVGAVVTGAAALYLHRQRREYTHIPGPPLDSFWTGNFSMMSKAAKEETPFIVVLHDLISEYGKTFKFVVFHKIMVMTVDRAAIKELLVLGEHPKCKPSYEPFVSLFGQRWLGHGLVSNCDHENWSKKRNLINPAFHRKYLMSLMSQFNLISDKFLEKMGKLADDKTSVTMLKEFNRTTLDVIGQVAFGMDIDSINKADSPFPTAIYRTFEGLQEYFKGPIAIFNPKRNKFRQDVRQAIKFLRNYGHQLIKERRQAIADGDNYPEDILTHCVKVADEHPLLFPNEDLVDEYMTIFIAGQETTATTLTFAIMALGKHPEVEQRLREEIDDVLGDRVEVTYTDLGKMTYTDCVFKETLRLYPPGVLTLRAPEKDHVIDGYRVPAKATVATSPYIVGRMEEYHKDAMVFRPERFLKEDERPNAYSYFPFSLGPRSCIGQTFAQMEAKVVLGKFLQRFDFKLDPDQSFKIIQTATLRPKDGTRCWLTMRRSKD